MNEHDAKRWELLRTIADEECQKVWPMLANRIRARIKKEFPGRTIVSGLGVAKATCHHPPAKNDTRGGIRIDSSRYVSRIELPIVEIQWKASP